MQKAIPIIYISFLKESKKLRIHIRIMLRLKVFDKNLYKAHFRFFLLKI